MNERRGSGAPSGRQPILPGLFSSPKSRRLATPREQALETARARLVVIMALFALAWVVVGCRLSYLSLRGYPPEIQADNGGTDALADGPAQRADIIDRNGVVLATSLPTVSLCADAPNIPNPDEVAKQLLAILPGLDAKKLGDALHSGKHCAAVMRHLTPHQYYQVNALGVAGLQFLPDERRVYPAGSAAAHVLGYTDIDGNGIAGIEKSMNDRLTDDPEPLQLSIDLRVQTILRDRLLQAMNDFHAVGAAALVMNIKTGELLSLVSLPDFDPDHPGDATPDQLFNRATLGVYEMGSTFKIFNTALALDSGLVHIGDMFDVTKPPKIGSHPIHDFEKEHHPLNVAEIFAHSSNIGSAEMVERLGPQRQRAFFAQLGLTKRLSLEIPEVGAPLIASARDWTIPTMLAASFGHGIAVNAVQMAGAVATIVNNGIPVRPTLLKNEAPPDDDGADAVISPHTSAMIRALMRLVVTRGTARLADVPGYMIGGKTGTADKIGANHHYLNNARRSSLISIFPVQAPQYLIYVMLDDPKGDAKTDGFATGGWTAAPVVRDVVAQIGPLLDIAPLSEEAAATTERRIMRVLGDETVDGISVQESVHHATINPGKFE
ncbi:MAG: penicillin-binding protein 2 [Alphaproteobacteria bacterium]|nr:penicillin-binding protein 2 [Alphaproteobacteria bacterium]